MQIKHICFVTWLLFFTFSVANAIPKQDIESLCKESKVKDSRADVAFCVTQLGANPQIAAARDLSNVLAIVITMSKKQVGDATAHINSVTGKFNGPNGKRRVSFCKKNYGIASAKLQSASEKALKKPSFLEAFQLARDGTIAVNDCEFGWKSNGPVQKSPVTLYTTNVTKLYRIIALLAQKLGV